MCTRTFLGYKYWIGMETSEGRKVRAAISPEAHRGVDGVVYGLIMMHQT